MYQEAQGIAPSGKEGRQSKIEEMSEEERIKEVTQLLEEFEIRLNEEKITEIGYRDSLAQRLRGEMRELWIGKEGEALILFVGSRFLRGSWIGRCLVRMGNWSMMGLGIKGVV